MCADTGNLHTSLEFACPLSWFPSPAQVSYPPKDPDDSFLDLGLHLCHNILLELPKLEPELGSASPPFPPKVTGETGICQS